MRYRCCASTRTWCARCATNTHATRLRAAACASWPCCPRCRCRRWDSSPDEAASPRRRWCWSLRRPSGPQVAPRPPWVRRPGAVPPGDASAGVSAPGARRPAPGDLVRTCGGPVPVRSSGRCLGPGSVDIDPPSTPTAGWHGAAPALGRRREAAQRE